MSTTLTRASQIIEALARSRSSNIRELAATLSLSKSAAHRLLKSLAEIGWVEKRGDTGSYTLSMKLIQLGELIASGIDFKQEAEPFLKRLSKETGETTHLGTLDGNDVIYLDRVDSTHVLTVNSRVGNRAPIWCTGIGKALLAYNSDEIRNRILSQITLKAYTKHTIAGVRLLQRDFALIRKRGYATGNEEWITGVDSVAAPIRDRSGYAVAAISIVGPSIRMRPHVHKYGKRLRAIADALSKRLGASNENLPRI